MNIQHTYRQAIRTKYIGPTNHRGARIKAYSWAGSVTVDYDYSLNEEERHAKAALALIEKFEWESKTLVSGGSDCANGYFFILMD